MIFFFLNGAGNVGKWSPFCFNCSCHVQSSITVFLILENVYLATEIKILSYLEAELQERKKMMAAISLTEKICDGPTSKNLPYDMLYHCANFHAFIVKCTIGSNFGYYSSTRQWNTIQCIWYVNISIRSRWSSLGVIIWRWSSLGNYLKVIIRRTSLGGHHQEVIIRRS